MNLYGGIILAAVLLLTGCAALSRTGDAAKHLIVLRATWELPAKQAGVRDEMEHHVRRLDAALSTGNPARVRAVLLSLEPIYREVYDSVELPTPQQVQFHDRAMELWDLIQDAESGEWMMELAHIILVGLARRAV